jgi:flagellar hook-associated protein 3
MNIRVTQQILVDQAIGNVQQNYSRLNALQAQASTGLRINQVSDDPTAAVRALLADAGNARLDSYHQNISGAQGDLNSSVTTLTSVGQLLAQAKTLAIQGANAGNDPTTDTALADQVDSILHQLVNLANSKSGDRYLYGGTASQSPPFVVGPPDAQGQTHVVYQGSDQRAGSPVGETQSVDTLYTGSEVFQATARAPTVFTGTTGAAPGTGTDSATGQGTLIVTHTSTTYAAGSGVQPGTNSAAGDTALGPTGAHTLTIVDTSGNGSAGTVSIDGGPAVAFTNADTNLRVASAGGAAVYLNTTAITAGFNGAVAVTGNGALSVDGGATTTALNFSGNQVVTDSLTGAVTNIDSTKVTQTGTDQVNHSGTYDAFQILQALSADLRNAAGTSATNPSASISSRIGELDRVRTNVLGVVGEQSSSLQNLDAIDRHATAVQLQTKELVGNLESADIPTVLVDVQQQQNLLQLSLESASQLFNTSLLSFLK